MRFYKISLTVCIVLLCFEVDAQTDSTHVKTAAEMSKERQDPVAGLRSIYLQEILLPVGNGTAQSLSIQPVWPIKLADNLKLITYTIIPIQTLPGLEPGTSSKTGLGNILFNGYFSSINKPGKISWGVGPALQIPTRTYDALGSNRVSLGPSALFNYGSDTFSGGFVVQNYWSIGGKGFNQVNSFSFQYFMYYNLPKAWFLVSNATIINNWLSNKGDQLLFPVGGGAGKTFKMGNSGLFYCLAAQVFYNVEHPSIVGNWEAVFQFQLIL